MYPSDPTASTDPNIKFPLWLILLRFVCSEASIALPVHVAVRWQEKLKGSFSREQVKEYFKAFMQRCSLVRKGGCESPASCCSGWSMGFWCRPCPPPILSLLNCRLPSSETERFYQVAHLINLLRMYADVALILTLCQYKVAGGMTYIVFC